MKVHTFFNYYGSRNSRTGPKLDWECFGNFFGNFDSPAITPTANSVMSFALFALCFHRRLHSPAWFTHVSPLRGGPITPFCGEFQWDTVFIGLYRHIPCNSSGNESARDSNRHGILFCCWRNSLR